MSWIRRETEKGTVQYICPHCHDYHEFREDFGGRTFSENYIFCRRCGARNGTGNAPTLTPPNEPLTIEQLREMKDEPAYLKVFDPLLKSGWHIIKAVTKDKIIFRGWQTVYVPIDGMGVDYNLYRRPPEGEEILNNDKS